MARDTIYALSSAPGRAGVAVVRVSGPEAARAAEALTGKPLPAPRMAALRTLATIDQALVLFFPASKSFTGEDVVEFHVHGGRATVEALFAALSPFARPADRGEFTRRAVENGKLDLTRAEAIADLIDAETDAQRRQALRQYDGALAELYEGWRTALIRASALAEAGIDFADEELPEDVLAQARAAVATVLAEIRRHLDDRHRGERLREGLYLAVIGPPNAGKSSLVNALARRDVAIVAETAGTTRDVIEVRLDLGGYPVTVADTAGLRDAADTVEAEGIRRALARAESADLVLLLLDASAEVPPRVRADLVVWNKSDLKRREGGLSISLRTGEGFDALLAALTAKVRDRLEARDDAPVLTRARHRRALDRAAHALDFALRVPADRPELFAEDLRLAMRALGRITGRVDVEELLDVVFGEFCIGK